MTTAGATVGVTSRGRAPRRRRARRSRFLAGTIVVVVVAFLFLPIAVTVAFAFASSPTLGFPVKGLTLGWFHAALTDPLAVPALETSLRLAAFTALIAGSCGTAAAVGARKFGPKIRARVGYGALMPSVIPPLVLGVALAVGFHAAGIQLGFATALVGHVMITMPFVFLTVRARLESLDANAVQAARDLGASSVRAFWDITFALIRPAVLSAALLAASLSLDEFVVTSFTIGAGQSLPLLIWARTRQGITPEVNALATLILAGTLSTGLVAYRASRIRL